MFRRAPAGQLIPICSFINASIFLLYDLHYLSQEISLTPKLLKDLLRLWGHICWFYQAGLPRKKGGTRKPLCLPLTWGGYWKPAPVVNQVKDLQGSLEAQGALLALVQPWKSCSKATQVS